MNNFVKDTIDYKKQRRRQRNIAKRYRKERYLRFWGMFAISVSCIFLALLVSSVVVRGYKAFFQTEIKLTIDLDEAIIDPQGERSADAIMQADYRLLIHRALQQKFPEVTTRREKGRLYRMMSSEAPYQILAMIQNAPEYIGQKETIWLKMSSHVDVQYKNGLENVSESLKDWLVQLEEEEGVRLAFNKGFFTTGDSRYPEQAGFFGAMVGSFFVIIVCMLLSFPLGVLAAIYLEEFAPKNRFTDIIEININNLAAVPSIIFGLLGLVLYLNLFGLPRSSSLVGGVTLALMVLPTIIIATRNAIQAVPPSIKEGAIGLGASKVQVAFHHTLPLAMPGIMTGSILAVARALGETAPLLMIGMVAFIRDVPESAFEPATVMPVQIYQWAGEAELGYGEKTAAGILVLLFFLIIANAIAIYIRNKFERRW